MSGSIFGKNFTITTWGESHGPAIGVVIDGCPSGIDIDTEYIYKYLSRRKPKSSIASTTRYEDDIPEILSGIYNGKTLGTPISILIKNKNIKSHDYDNIKNIYRPSHADFTYDKKYSNVDYRGGGRASARETIGRVIAGAISSKILSRYGIHTSSFVQSIGSVQLNENDIDFSEKNELNIPNRSAYDKAKIMLTSLKNKKDSVGGSIITFINNPLIGLGEPVFRKLDALLSYGLMSIGGVKAVEIGAGISSSLKFGSDFNDQMFPPAKFLNNNSGGILGGISNGNIIKIKTHFKPTPSISIPQNTVDKNGKNCSITIEGRHDPTIVVRACVVVESMVNIVLTDLLLENCLCDINLIDKIYTYRKDKNE